MFGLRTWAQDHLVKFRFACLMIHFKKYEPYETGFRMLKGRDFHLFPLYSSLRKNFKPGFRTFCTVKFSVLYPNQDPDPEKSNGSELNRILNHVCHTYCSQLVKIRIFCRWQEALYSTVMDNKVIDDMGYTVYIYIQGTLSVTVNSG